MKFLAKLFYIATWFFVWGLFKIFVRLKVKRPKELKVERPLIIAANHLSFVDPFIVGASFRLSSAVHPMNFMVDDQWMKSLWAPLIRIWGGFPAYRKMGLDVSLKLPKETIKKQGVVLIFPRGRRRQRFHAKKGKIGTAVLALETKSLILPVKISDSAPGNGWKFLLRKRRIRVTVGHPFYLQEDLGLKKNYSVEDIRRGTEIIVRKISRLSWNYGDNNSKK